MFLLLTNDCDPLYTNILMALIHRRKFSIVSLWNVCLPNGRFYNYLHSVITFLSTQLASSTSFIYEKLYFPREINCIRSNDVFIPHCLSMDVILSP